MPEFLSPRARCPLLLNQEAPGLIQDYPIAQFEIGPFRNFVYLVLDWKAPFGKRPAAVIDPQSDLSTVLTPLQDHGFKLEKILLTHTHHDHTAGIDPLRAQLPSLPIFLHQGDEFRLKKKRYPHLQFLQDGEFFRVGSLILEALHTPGHSRGGLCYRMSLPTSSADSEPEFALFTGDTLFIRDCGRTDLETGDDEAMFQSLQKLKRLPGSTLILPGHHYAPECATLLADEIQTSSALQCESVEELKSLN